MQGGREIFMSGGYFARVVNMLTRKPSSGQTIIRVGFLRMAIFASSQTELRLWNKEDAPHPCSEARGMQWVNLGKGGSSRVIPQVSLGNFPCEKYAFKIFHHLGMVEIIASSKVVLRPILHNPYVMNICSFLEQQLHAVVWPLQVAPINWITLVIVLGFVFAPWSRRSRTIFKFPFRSTMCSAIELLLL